MASRVPVPHCPDSADSGMSHMGQMKQQGCGSKTVMNSVHQYIPKNTVNKSTMLIPIPTKYLTRSPFETPTLEQPKVRDTTAVTTYNCNIARMTRRSRIKKKLESEKIFRAQINLKRLESEKIFRPQINLKRIEPEKIFSPQINLKRLEPEKFSPQVNLKGLEAKRKALGSKSKGTTLKVVRKMTPSVGTLSSQKPRVIDGLIGSSEITLYEKRMKIATVLSKEHYQMYLGRELVVDSSADEEERYFLDTRV